MTEGRNGLSLRGHRPITPENLGPDEMMLPQMTLFGRPEIEITINNAVLSKRYENTFASRKLMELLEQPLQRLDESQIKRILTPRGWIRCTEEVVLWFSLPETSPGHYVIRVLVLPEEHPHPGVSLIIGRPMIEHLDLINRVQALPYVTPFVMQDSVDSHDTVTTFDVIPSHQTRDDGSAHGSGPKR
ncbi:hypothetical protein B0T14DRAFT_267902 [Immersiella caudata]|uniref:Uncharacterized protein n=1 Tax=Immersiella caudata TaxID=314043 RepID=A0AA39WL32_9PEZI|nr:hypothetical protein B0T14DRAFT_267902 [Immersiella caudata]